MHDQLPHIVTCAFLTLSLIGSMQVACAKKLKVPKSCPVHKHKDSCDPTLFSTPDADADVLPVFVGKKGQPLSTDMELRLPGFDHARLLPDLTEEQKKKIRELQNDMNMRIQAIQEHINNINGRLDVAKGHPTTKITIQNQTLPPANDMKEEIADLRKQIQQKRKDAVQQLDTLLTEEQRDQIKRMRRGEMVREDGK